MEKLNLNKYNKENFNYKGKYKEVGFVAFPRTMFFDKRLGVYHLKVAGVLEVHKFQGKEKCFPSLDTISAESGISRPVVIRCLKELEKFEYLETSKNEGKSTHYYLKFW